MDQRYKNELVDELWSQGWTYAAWLAIETRTLEAQRQFGVVPADETEQLVKELHGMAFQDADIPDVLAIEERTRHDVVAFLEWLRGGLSEMDTDGRWIHFGLTSSDVVDTAQGMRFRQMKLPLLSTLGTLVSEVTRLLLDQTPVLGRTHGQVAEPMEMGIRATGWLTLLQTGIGDLSRYTSRMAVCKLSGPVGTYAHNPAEIEMQVAADLDLHPHGPGATQIASRAPLAAWATSANLVMQACAKICHDIRLMHLLGDADVKLAAGQVGSSSMAHKTNPIRAERVEGLARMGAGYAQMLSHVGTWLERDIAHSSVERVAVPDLWHALIFCIEETSMVLRDLTVRRHADVPDDAWVSWMTLRGIERGKPVELAREWANLQAHLHPFDAAVELEPPSLDVYSRNYPWGLDR